MRRVTRGVGTDGVSVIKLLMDGWIGERVQIEKAGGGSCSCHTPQFIFVVSLCKLGPVPWTLILLMSPRFYVSEAGDNILLLTTTLPVL